MVNILLMLMHVYIWNKHKKYKNYLMIQSFFFIAISFITIILFQIEVANLNLQGTYGSDETAYYKSMMLIVEGYAHPSQFSAPFYNWIGSIVLKTSFYKSVINIRVFNVLIFSLALNMFYVVIRNRFDKIINIKLFRFLFFLSSVNGIILWTTIRNLKDILYCSLIIFLVYFTEEFLKVENKMKRTILLISTYFVLFFIFQNMRPFGGITAIIIGFSITIIKQGKIKFNFKRILTGKHGRYMVVFVLLGIWYISNRINFELLGAFRKLIYTPMGSGKGSIIAIPLEAIRFILGPGPFNSLKQLVYGDVFLVSTNLADFLIFCGALFWWIILYVLFIKFLLNTKRFIYVVSKSFDFFMITLFIISTYTYVYGGTGDTRLRAIMYIASYGFILPFLTLYKTDID